MGQPNRPTGLQTAGGIPYSIIEGYPKLSFTDLEPPRVVEKYLIKSPNALAFFLDSFPPPDLQGGTLVLPKRRTMPNAPWLVTTDLEFEPHSGQLPWDPMGNDPNAPADTYDAHCIATITYETVREDARDPTKPETFLERSLSAGGEYMSIPAGKSQVSTATIGSLPSVGNTEENKDKDMPMFKIIPTIEWNLKWPYVINPWWSIIFSSLGKVNFEVMPVFESAAKETVLFMGVNATQKYLWNGQTLGAQFTLNPWEINFKFSHKYFIENGQTLGWNHVWSKQKQTWVKPTRGTNLLPLYAFASFSNMFLTNPSP